MHTLLDSALELTKEALGSPAGTAQLLKTYDLGHSFRAQDLLHLLERYNLAELFDTDTLLRKARNHALYHVLRDLKYRARIPSE